MTTSSRVLLAALAAIAGTAAANTAYAAEYANVISATPVVSQVAVPNQTCTDQVERVQRQPTGAGAVLGAIAGGVVGNAVGGGFGRAAATGLGVVAGAAVGNNVEANGSSPVDVPVRRCQNGATIESRAVGYDVVYEYGGKRYTARMASDPGQRLAVDVRPYAQATSPAPVEPVPVAPVVTYAAPAYYPAPVYAPSYYGPGYYAAPVIGFGLGFGFGRGYGYHGGYGGDGGHHHWH